MDRTNAERQRRYIARLKARAAVSNDPPPDRAALGTKIDLTAEPHAIADILAEAMPIDRFERLAIFMRRKNVALRRVAKPKSPKPRKPK
jgi:hypothetical protein